MNNVSKINNLFQMFDLLLPPQVVNKKPKYFFKYRPYLEYFVIRVGTQSCLMWNILVYVYATYDIPT